MAMEILPYPSINDRAAQSKNTQRSRGYASVFQTNARHKAKHEKGSHHQKIQAHIIKILQNLRAVRNVSCPHTGKAKRKPIKEKQSKGIAKNSLEYLNFNASDFNWLNMPAASDQFFKIRFQIFSLH